MLWIASRQGDSWLQENGRPAQRPEVDRSNVVLYLDITATQIIMITVMC